MKKKYPRSQEALKRAKITIPQGCQTYSKSYLQYPTGIAPHFVSRAKGCRIWDIDDNKFIDYVNALCAVSLGYCDEDIDEQVISQIKKGINFSLPNLLEIELSELICSQIPCAQMTRFAKNGTDVTTAAIRIARTYTKRSHVAACGYHGWQDWYIGKTNKDFGVLDCIKNYTHMFEYNNIMSLEAIFDEFPGDVAAVIMEPMNHTWPSNDFLRSVRALCDRNNSVLIFDEMITGFRFHMGGAQELFNVYPDLATFGKGMANGYPLAALTGNRDLMILFEDVFFSGTYGGECASIAAAIATINKMLDTNFPSYITELGNHLCDRLKEITSKLCNSFVDVKGHPAWSFLQFKDFDGISGQQIKTYWLQEIIDRGILCLGTHNLSYSHQIKDIDKLVDIYNDVFFEIDKLINNNALVDNLRCESIQPAFKVR